MAKKNMVMIDGNNAAAHVAHALSEVIAICPITPSTLRCLSILALILTSGLAFVSCWTTGGLDEPTQFEGRWLNLAAINDYRYTDFLSQFRIKQS